MESDSGVGMRCEVIEELLASLHRLFGAVGLLAGNCAEGYENGKVDGASIVKYAPDDALDLLLFFLGKGGEVSSLIGRCASLSYCFGCEEKRQCCGLEGKACL